SVTNQKCIHCHAGRVHHRNQLDDRSCACCHRDHQGRDHSLVRIPDSDCTSCHADLGNHIQRGPVSLAVNEHVTRFAEVPHPAFRSIKTDPGKLKFNHKLHLTA